MDLLMWNTVKATVRKKLNLTNISFATWIVPLDFSIEGKTIYIIVPAETGLARRFIEAKYGATFQSVLCEHLGNQFKVKFVIGKA